MPSIIFNTNRCNLDIVAQGKVFPTVKEFVSMVITFLLTVFAWIFFRSNTLEQAMSYISRIFSASLFSIPVFKMMILSIPILILVFLFLLVEWFGREQQYAIAKLFSNKPFLFRIGFYYLILVFIFLFAGANQQFIYFQF